MKRLLLAVFISLMALPAHAGWNLKQNDDGTTSWVREDVNGVQRSHDVGSVYLSVYLADVSAASTTYIPIPVTNVRVSYIQSVLHGVITSADNLLQVYNYSSNNNLVGEVTNATGRMTIANSGSSSGVVDTFTPTEAAANYMEQGSVLTIFSPGSSAGEAPIRFTITLVPRDG